MLKKELFHATDTLAESTEECHACSLLILKSLHSNEAYWMHCWHKQGNYTSSLTTALWFLREDKPKKRNEIKQQEIRRCSLIFLNSKDNILRGICSITCCYCKFLLFHTPKAPRPSASPSLYAYSVLAMRGSGCQRSSSLLGTVSADLWLDSPCGCACSKANGRILIHFQREDKLKS